MVETYWRVERVLGDDLGFPLRKAAALAEIRERMDREPLGDPLRVVRLHYRLDPEAPPSTHTPALRRIWRATVVRFPEIGSAGVAVCKPSSQHRFGNAADWTAPPGLSTDELIAYLWRVFDFLRAAGMVHERTAGREGLPVSELIFRDKISTRAQGWLVRPYTGTFHAAHVHSSGFPLIDPNRPCT